VSLLLLFRPQPDGEFAMTDAEAVLMSRFLMSRYGV
jgi:hypothetical protein